MIHTPHYQKDFVNKHMTPPLKEMWKHHSLECMDYVLRLKFSQNVTFSRTLRSTDDRLIIECNPYDRFYSCGKSIQELKAHKYEYDGLNKLGSILMEIRNEMKCHDKIFIPSMDSLSIIKYLFPQN